MKSSIIGISLLLNLLPTKSGEPLILAWGVSRISHINDQPVEEWGVPLDTTRRPDEDTLDQYLNRLIESDDVRGHII